MDKVNFQDGTKISSAKVTIDEVDYPVTPARYTGATPLSANVMNIMQDNIEDAIDQNVSNIGGEEYDETATYEEGDIVKYEGQLYICIEAIDTPEEWDSTKWNATDVLSSAGGNEVTIGAPEDITGKTKIFIDESEGTDAYSEVVNSLEGNEIAKAPSVRAVNEASVIVSATEPQGNDRRKVWKQFTGNLFDVNNITNQTYISSSSGTTSSNVSWIVTNYIPVVPGEKITINGISYSTLGEGVYGIYYDSSKSVVSSITYADYKTNGTILTIPDGINYVRLSMPIQSKDTIKVYVEDKEYILNDNGVYEEFLPNEPVQLFYSYNGDNSSTIALNDNPYNYKYIEIRFGAARTECSWSKIYRNSFGSNQRISYLSNLVYNCFETITISTTSLTISNKSVNGWGSDTPSIFEVLGYK